MHRITTLECLCGAPLDEIDTDHGIAFACPDCGRDTWPEHITLEPAVSSDAHWPADSRWQMGFGPL